LNVLRQIEYKDSVDYQDFKQSYEKRYYLCGRLGAYFDPLDGLIKPHVCNNWECSICRPKKKYILLLEIIKNVYNFDLQKHFIITFGGKQLRDQVSWDGSYIFMNKQWHKFINVINRKYGKLIYILFPRAQGDGYCHYHILLQKYIPWKFLNEKRKNYDLGFVSIQRNKDVAEYLSTDYFKDDEWKIPFNVRRFRTSREIVLRNYCNNSLDWKKNQIYDLTGDKSFDEKMIFKKFDVEVDLDSIWNDTYLELYLKWLNFPNSMIEKQKQIDEMFGDLLQKEPRKKFLKTGEAYYKW